jgi:diguanylate cyclase (GGDEF)-like protein
MHADGRLLVIGSRGLCDEVGRILPGFQREFAEHALAGLWSAGQSPFDAVLISVGAARKLPRFIRNLRRVSPSTRAIVVCAPAEEPQARTALAAGADDYVLEPVAAEELQRALQIEAPAPVRPVEPPAPTPQEIVRLSDVLRNLGEGPRETLDRLARLLRDSFGARSAAITIDDLTVAAGEAHAPVLEEPIRREGETIGGVALGAACAGAYTTAAAARLADYARLIEAVIGQVREQSRWRSLAWTDDLSGLHNRRYFERSLDDLIARCTEQRSQLTLLLFDIDDFKSYNDRYGHETGDALIREVAELLRTCTRESDVIVRYGGDEFAVIFWDAEKPRVPGSRHPTDIMAVAERFCGSIASHNFQCLGRAAPGPVTISGGMACFPWDGRARGHLLRAADEALLQAKREGKNRIVIAGGNGGAGDEPEELIPAAS